MLKKIISSIAALAMVGSIAVIPAMAAQTCEYTLGSGVTFTDGLDEYDSAYFTINMAALADGSYASAGTIEMSFEGGTILTDDGTYGVANVENKAGLCTGTGRAKKFVEPTIGARADGMTLSFATTAPAYSADGMVFEVYISPEDTTKDIIITVGTLANGNQSNVTYCASDNAGADLNTVKSAADYSKKYVLKAGTSTIEEYSETPAVTTYAVTAGEGIASVDKTEAAEGDTVNFTVAEAPTGKELADIKVNGESIGKEATSFTMPAAAATVTAEFTDIVVPEPDPEVSFVSDEVTANNAVGFWSKLSALENAGEVTAAGFVFANVDDVKKPLETSQIKVADTLDLGQTITYEFKNLTGFDKFGLKAKAYIVTEKGTFWSDVFGSLIDIIK